ncbi:MAG: efflux RND transporter periplasmic adaptor subunit [Halomonadaceae bacterium]|nr:MAG: efflux RND transporter periplasmic adaptor subunit [Halomonadaceae bacterium]
MKVIYLLLALLLGAAAGGSGIYLWLSATMDHGAQASSGNGEILHYRHPHDRSITSDEPMKDSMGMDYIPVYADKGNGAEDEAGVVRINPAVTQNLGVRTAKAERGSLTPTIDALGFVAYDEAGLVHAHVRTEAWVEDLQVRTTGERVAQGQILFRIDSPRLRSAQEELLQAVRRNAGIASARERLASLGMADEDIRRVQQRGEILQLVPVRARREGVVQALNVSEGMFVTPGTTLIEIVDLSRVWLMLEVFEADMDSLATGQSASVTLPFRPDTHLAAEVDYIYPNLQAGSRTQRARLVLDNPDGELRPGMVARVALEGQALEESVHVPAEALIRTGRQNRVIVALEEGRFQVREVKPGRRVGDRFVILEGIEAGEAVVVSGQFLIDSEAGAAAELGRMHSEEGGTEEGVWTEGRIVSLAEDGTSAMLYHEPVPEWNWPSMTMEFQLAEDLEKEALKPDMPIHFRMREHPEGGYEVMEIHPLEETDDDHSDDHDGHHHGDLGGSDGPGGMA